MPLDWPLPPMEARQVDAIPDGPGWQYEPKWDGFRCLLRHDGAALDLRSKSGQPLARYFPDVVEALAALAGPFVLDGELVVPVDGELSFEELQLRLHPAASRVRILAERHPATLMAFDLLEDLDGRDLTDQPLSERRRCLEAFAGASVSPRLRLSPATPDRDVARQWFDRTGGGLDGIVAKRLDLPYRAGERDGMVKYKHLRTADCVVGGFRHGTDGKGVGSLLLGLYGDDGLLHHVGFTSAIKDRDRARIAELLNTVAGGEGFTGCAPGGPSRWSRGRSAEWVPLQPKLVVEVCYDHVTGGRFRHGVGLLRWRPDKAPEQCRIDQLARETASALALAHPTAEKP